MRLLGEIIIVGALIYIGWATPFRDRFPASISGVAKSPNAGAASHSNATATSQPMNASAAPPATIRKSLLRIYGGRVDIYTLRRLDVGPESPFCFRSPNTEAVSAVAKTYSNTSSSC